MCVDCCTEVVTCAGCVVAIGLQEAVQSHTRIGPPTLCMCRLGCSPLPINCRYCVYCSMRYVCVYEACTTSYGRNETCSKFSTYCTWGSIAVQVSYDSSRVNANACCRRGAVCRLVVVGGLAADETRVAVETVLFDCEASSRPSC